MPKTSKHWIELLEAAQEIKGDLLRSDVTYEAVRYEALNRLEDAIEAARQIHRETDND